MPAFHGSRSLGRPVRCPMEAPPLGVWKLEQRLQGIRPLGRPGIWELLHQHLAGSPDMEFLIIDSTLVRAHPCAAGASPKKAAKRLRPWDGAGVGSAPRST